jgi:hypothetical protein
LSLWLPGAVVVRAVGPDEIELACRLECEAIQPHVRYQLRAALDKQSAVEAEAGDCFEGLRLVRARLELDGVRLCCAGARRDVWASGMQRDMGQGLTAYVLSLPRTAERPSVVDIFEPSPPDLIATVAEQKEFYQQWLNSPLAAD